MTTEFIDMEDVLKRVSRSFYLTLRILPRSIKPQLGLAYLLARATDTVADTDVIDVRYRQQVLADLATSIQAASEDQKTLVPDFTAFIESAKPGSDEGNEAEQILLKNFNLLLESLRKCAAGDRPLIRTVLEIITHGQETDLVRFANSGKSLTALSTDEELDIYTYEVAGCVGEFWTRLCRAHVFPHAPLDDKLLLSDSIRFGKGLQLVNILRDLPKDLRNGRCYIPAQRLSEHDLEPGDLLNIGTMDRFRPLYDTYLQQADDHLRAGWRYTTSLPFVCLRVRLACAWPILIGVQTLNSLRRRNVLDSSQQVKVCRSEIWRLIRKSVFLYPKPGAWNRLFEAIRTEQAGGSRDPHSDA